MTEAGSGAHPPLQRIDVATDKLSGRHLLNFTGLGDHILKRIPGTAGPYVPDAPARRPPAGRPQQFR